MKGIRYYKFSKGKSGVDLYKRGLILTLRYYASATFNAKTEAEELMARFSNPGTEIAELSSVIDALHSLFEAAENKKEIGFNGIRHKWEKTAFEGLFLYSDTGVFAAINVPGNGRAQTFDLTLAGMAFAKNNTGDIRKDVDAFLTQVNERRRKDNEHDWE